MKDEKFEERLIEKLANIEHERWSGWQKYLHSLCHKEENGELTIPKYCVERWERQINTPYSELSEEEKESDRIEARKTLPIILAEKKRSYEEGRKSNTIGSDNPFYASVDNGGVTPV
jgi:hypothetical protein